MTVVVTSEWKLVSNIEQEHNTNVTSNHDLGYQGLEAAM